VGKTGEVEHGRELIEFADASVARSASLPAARQAVREAMGPKELVDAAAIVGNFQRMVRIADGTGIQLDEIAEVPSRAFRGRMGIDEFASAQGRGSH